MTFFFPFLILCCLFAFEMFHLQVRSNSPSYKYYTGKIKEYIKEQVNQRKAYIDMRTSREQQISKKYPAPGISEPDMGSLDSVNYWKERKKRYFVFAWEWCARDEGQIKNIYIWRAMTF